MLSVLGKALYDPHVVLLRPTGNVLILKEHGEARPPAEPDKQARGSDGLSDQQRDVLRDLRARDREVRAHEKTHMAVAGPLAKGGPSYEYVIGPDGKPYAIGGEVRVDTSTGPDAAKNARHADRLAAAALAVKDPSLADQQVANESATMKAESPRTLYQNWQRSEERGEMLSAWG
ncbi:MAG: hypothetical protein H7A21_15475 [Spirochaetales bacterium]|nr:hypothetical protein [Leptospiraceae bacterium]MCP5482836.1 hypothetical protein [Spirochaetales bacterium]